MPQTQTRTRRNDAHVSSACASCQQSKRKCDGVQPACGPCSRMHKDCVWKADEDRRTVRGRSLKCPSCQALRAQVAQLEKRVQELEAQSVVQTTVSDAPFLGAPQLLGSAIEQPFKFQLPLFPPDSQITFFDQPTSLPPFGYLESQSHYTPPIANGYPTVGPSFGPQYFIHEGTHGQFDARSAFDVQL
ncbi:hypothetical protein AURDEDRAFT_163471 [Auricularia subglabra TFB-10046 SS5]|nr:hypothetical protein AURDEDRAFT_163471 [Auricularia subglabra TFB-10046 SS5]